MAVSKNENPSINSAKQGILIFFTTYKTHQKSLIKGNLRLIHRSWLLWYCISTKYWFLNKKSNFNGLNRLIDKLLDPMPFVLRKFIIDELRYRLPTLYQDEAESIVLYKIIKTLAYTDILSEQEIIAEVYKLSDKELIALHLNIFSNKTLLKRSHNLHFLIID